MISNTPADTTSADTTQVARTPLTSTWLHLVGLRPYELLGLADRSSGTRNPVRPLPRLDLAA